MGSQSEKTTELSKARENAADHGVINFSFASDWLKTWHESSGPITERSKANAVRITFDTQLKIARNHNNQSEFTTVYSKLK